MSKFTRPCATKLFFAHEGPLDELAEQIQQAGIIGAYELDYENVSEWFTAPLRRGQGIELNVSREHGGSDEDEEAAEGPVHVLLMAREDPDQALVDDLAVELATLLDVEVAVGEIEYLGGDDYRLDAERRFTPAR